MATSATNPVYEGIENQLPQLRRYACALTRNGTAADDLVQECVARALSKSHLYRQGTNLRAWLFTILHNLYVSDMRQRARTGYTVDPDDVQGGGLSMAPRQEDRIELETLGDALEALPYSQRRAVELISLNGLSYESAAKIMKLPVGTLKSRVSRGRLRLRDALDGKETAGRSERQHNHSYGAVPSFSAQGHRPSRSAAA